MVLWIIWNDLKVDELYEAQRALLRIIILIAFYMKHQMMRYYMRARDAADLSRRQSDDRVSSF